MVWSSIRKKNRIGTAQSSNKAEQGSPSTQHGHTLSFIDLFCGCGGFSLGMLRAGFRCRAAIDLDEFAVNTFRKNLAEAEHVLQKDLTRYQPDELAGLIGCQRVDVIVGGPPCQGFSTARQADGANHGKRLKRDARRRLYQEFLKFVDYFQPRIFVIENVLGMRNAANGEYFTRVHHEARNLGKERGLPGYRVHAQVEEANALGVPQKRRRQLIIGVRADLPMHFVPELTPTKRADNSTTLGDAIGDLPILRAGGGTHERDYDLKRRADHLHKASIAAKNYLFNVLEVGKARKLTGHVARPQTQRDLRDFARLREGESSTVAMRDRGVKFEFPYDKSCFKDRYTRQTRKGPCSTIVAHMSKDGLMFIHPTQNRSLTAREAARVQSFPDWFEFPESRTKAYRLIGNAVPPLVAESVGKAVKTFLAECEACTRAVNRRPVAHRRQLAKELIALSELDHSKLQAIPTKEFLKGWAALFALLPELHPNNALDHGLQKSASDELTELFPSLVRRKNRRYLRSGWPLAFVQIGREAWKRKEQGLIQTEEFYCSSVPGLHFVSEKEMDGREQR